MYQFEVEINQPLASHFQFHQNHLLNLFFVFAVVASIWHFVLLAYGDHRCKYDEPVNVVNFSIFFFYRYKYV